MSIVTFQPTSFDPPQFPVRRFSVEEYHRLGEVGVLTDDDKVELIEGLVVPKMNRSPLHDVSLSMLDNALRKRLPESWKSRCQMAITTADSEPEPDIAVVRGPLVRYIEHHPHPADIALVIEVSETSLQRDRRKARVYARAAIPCYWIVNLRDRCVEVHAQPQTTAAEPFYASVVAMRSDESCELSLLGESVAAIAVGEFLPLHGTQDSPAS